MGLPIVALSLVAGLLSACSSGPSTSPAAGSPGGSVTNVRLTAYVGNLASLPVFVAIKNGYFAKNGINADIVTVQSGVTAAQALLSGSVDISSFGTDSLLTTVGQGQDITAIAACTKAVGELVYSSSESLPDAQAGFPAVIRDLKGKKIGVSAVGGESYYWVRYLIQQAGLNPDKDIQLVPVGAYAAAEAALKAGQIDGSFSSDPDTQQMTENGTAQVIFKFWSGNRPQIFDNLLTNVFAATGSYVKSNPKVVDDFYKAISEADTYISGLNSTSAGQLAPEIGSYFPGIPSAILAQGIVAYQGLYTPRITQAEMAAQNTFNTTVEGAKSSVAYDQAVAPVARQ